MSNFDSRFDQSPTIFVPSHLKILNKSYLHDCPFRTPLTYSYPAIPITVEVCNLVQLRTALFALTDCIHQLRSYLDDDKLCCLLFVLSDALNSMLLFYLCTPPFLDIVCD